MDKFGKQNLKFGIEVKKGWYNLVWQLTDTITSYLENNDKDAIFILEQIKEKFGGLRYYYSLKNATDSTNNIIMGMVWFAEHLSITICETCGGEGKHLNGGWIKTICDSCLEKKNKERKRKWNLK